MCSILVHFQDMGVALEKVVFLRVDLSKIEQPQFASRKFFSLSLFRAQNGIFVGTRGSHGYLKIM
jgi:hypothetical protein